MFKKLPAKLKVGSSKDVKLQYRPSTKFTNKQQSSRQFETL